MSDLHPDDIVRLAHSLNPPRAHLLVQALQDEGIRAKVVGDYLGAGFGDLAGVSAEVWVHKEDLGRAEKIMEKHNPSEGTE